MANPAAGRLSKVLVDADGIGSYTPVGGIQDATLDISTGSIDVSDHDSPGLASEFIYNRYVATIEMTMNYEEGDVGQDMLIDAALAGTVLFFEIQPKGALTGQQTYKAQGLVTKATIAGPNTAQSTLNCSVQLTGSLVQSAQP
jgi:predicted secreted protein